MPISAGTETNYLNVEETETSFMWAVPGSNVKGYV